VKAEAVSEPPKPWNGIKVMLVLEMADGSKQYPQIQMPGGTFDWKQVTQTIRLPKDIKKASLVVGLEEVSGRAWFDNIEVIVGRPERQGRRSETMFKGHGLPRLREEVLPAIEFQKAFNVQVYVGEFSVIRWAPGDSGYHYLRDVVELFEEYGWDWSYHAFREWDGWSVEHGPDRNDHRPTKTPTRRMELLLSWLAKNQRP
jgi:hypothetical protein